MKYYIIAGTLLILLALTSLFLPSYILEWQDGQRTEHSEIEEVQEVVLKEQLSMSLAQKMQILTEDTVNALSLYNGKNFSQNTISGQVRNELEVLAEKGILQNFSQENISVMDTSVFFYVDMEDSERSVMVWEVIIDTSNYHLNLLLDDETGKIVRAAQYESGDVTDYSEVSVGGQKIDFSIAESMHMNEEEVQELAQRWSEYLGCWVTDSRSAGIELQFADEREAFLIEVESLVRKGYSREEALVKTQLAWGISPGEETGNGILAELEDEGGRVEYVFWAEKDSLRIEPF